MITGELKSKIVRIWDSFWSGGISRPIGSPVSSVVWVGTLRGLGLVKWDPV